MICMDACNIVCVSVCVCVFEFGGDCHCRKDERKLFAGAGKLSVCYAYVIYNDWLVDSVEKSSDICLNSISRDCRWNMVQNNSTRKLLIKRIVHIAGRLQQLVITNFVH